MQVRYRTVKWFYARITNVLDFVRQILSDPKPRSSRWLSTCIPEESWNSPIAKMSSIAYHVKNLLSPVLFHVRRLKRHLLAAQRMCLLNYFFLRCQHSGGHISRTERRDRN